MNELAAFLRASSARPFVWGDRDCALWATAWIAARRGSDPAAYLRGTYDTALGCYRVLRREGGLYSLAVKIARNAGIASTDNPQSGDVVCATFGKRDALGICAGNRIAFKAAPHGLVFVHAPILAAWRI